MINSSLKRLTSYFRLTETSSITSLLLPWAVVLTVVGGTLVSFSSNNASHTLVQCHYNQGEARTGIQNARIVTGSIMVRTPEGAYRESVILLN